MSDLVVPSRKLHRIAAADLDAETAQTSGMRRYAAISGRSVGSQAIWMGQTIVTAGNISANHHHGDSETGIYVVSGTPEFIFLDGEGEAAQEVRLHAEPGDYIFVPPYVPHREENPSASVEAVVVIARSTQDAVVVNLTSLRDFVAQVHR